MKKISVADVSEKRLKVEKQILKQDPVSTPSLGEIFRN